MFWQTSQKEQANASKPLITLSTWGTPAEVQTLKQLLETFQEQYPHIQVRLRYMPDAYTQGLQLLVASQQTPDVMMLNSLDAPRFCQADLLSDLHEVSGLDLNAYFPTALHSMTSTKGVLCAVPRDVSNLVVFVNQDLLMNLPKTLQAGVHADWHLNDFPHMASVLDRHNQEHPNALPKWLMSAYHAPALFWLPFLWSEGVNLFHQDTLQFTPAVIQALEAYKALRYTPAFAPLRREVGSTTMTDLFIQGRLLFLVSGRWSVPFLRENADFQWDVLPFPQGKAGSRVGVDSTGYALSKRSRHPQEARALLRFLTSELSQTAWVQSGLIMPARQGLAESDWFLQAKQAPQQASVFLQAIQTGVASHYPPRWASLGQALNPVMEAYFNTPDLTLPEALARNGLSSLQTPLQTPPQRMGDTS